MRMWGGSGRKPNYVVLLMNEFYFHVIYKIVVLNGCDYDFMCDIMNEFVINVILHNWYVLINIWHNCDLYELVCTYHGLDR